MRYYLPLIPMNAFKFFENEGANTRTKILETHIAVKRDTTIPIQSINQNHLIRLTQIR